jgi:hypothetical protein
MQTGRAQAAISSACGHTAMAQMVSLPQSGLESNYLGLFNASAGAKELSFLD